MSKNKVEIRKSNIHGNGVFANYDIEIGEKLCEYSGDIRNIKDLSDNSYTWGDNYRCIDGYRTPKNEIGIGQFINCGNKLEVNELDSYLNILDKIQQYIPIAQEKQNVICKWVDGGSTRVDDKAFIYAIKPIKKDEELLMDYGPLYWMAKGVIKNKTPHMIKATAIFITIHNNDKLRQIDYEKIRSVIHVIERKGGFTLYLDDYNLDN